MKRSHYFIPTLKENPKEAEIVSHRLMLRAGMIKQTSAGIYAWLPLGLKVLKNIEQIVREEQNKAGAQEVLMPTLQSADLWRVPYNKRRLVKKYPGHYKSLFHPFRPQLSQAAHSDYLL